MTIQPLRIVALPNLVTIMKSIVYRWPYASTSPCFASPVRAISSSLVRSFGASAAVNPSAAAKARALCRPRGLSGFKQYSDSFRISTNARAPFGRRTTRHYAPGVGTATISRRAERLGSGAARNEPGHTQKSGPSKCQHPRRRLEPLVRLVQSPERRRSGTAAAAPAQNSLHGSESPTAIDLRKATVEGSEGQMSSLSCGLDNQTVGKPEGRPAPKLP